jgi:hypothetical protein
MVKPLWTINIHLKNEGQEYKTSPVQRVGSSGKGESEGGWIWSMYFVYLRKYKMKPVEIVLQIGEGVRGRLIGDESNQCTV